MRLIFAGTPQFAAPTLLKLIQSHHQLVAVLTQPDRPAGRGKKNQASPIKAIAVDHQLPLYQPTTLKDPHWQTRIEELNADAMIVVAYGLMIPEPLLNLTQYGCINIHPSLLPKWRGATPIQYALLHGESTTGVSIMQLDAGMDSGPILLQQDYNIPGKATCGELHDTLANIGAQCLLDTLTQLEQGRIQAAPQNATLATYTQKITKQDGAINWDQPARDIINSIRAYNPWPVAFTHLNQKTLRIWQAQTVAAQHQHPAGTVIDFNKNGLDIAARVGIVRATVLQLPGSKKLAVHDFYNAQRKNVIPLQTTLETRMT